MELFRFAVAGFNIIPTVLLGLVVFYWLIAIVGVFDFEIFDADVDLEGADGAGPISAFIAFLNVGQVPFALVFSLMVLNFWIIAMMMYFLPIEAGGVINGLLLIPALVVGVYIAKIQVLPFKEMFRKSKKQNGIKHKVLERRCRLLCDVDYDRLGQAELRQEGASIVINVTPEFKDEAFKKNEVAFVSRRDKEKDVYYISKTLLTNDYF